MRTTAIFCGIALLILAGCTSFEPVRSAQFVDDDNNYLHVDYGRDREDHETQFTLENGVRLPFRSKLKVRVELPSGNSFIAYQNMSPVGMLYKTVDTDWEYFESGTGCIVAQMAKDRSGYIPRFKGTLCASIRNPLNEKKERIRSGGSTPQGFGRESSGPRTVEENK